MNGGEVKFLQYLTSKTWRERPFRRLGMQENSNKMYKGRLKSSCTHLTRKRDRHRTSTQHSPYYSESELRKGAVSFSNKVSPRTFQNGPRTTRCIRQTSVHPLYSRHK